MLSLCFENVVAVDNGYGLEINGKSLEDIISTALGTKVGDVCGYGSDLPRFKSNCCRVVVTIDPKDEVVVIKDGDKIYRSVEKLEEERKNELEKKTTEADPEE